MQRKLSRDRQRSKVVARMKPSAMALLVPIYAVAGVATVLYVMFHLRKGAVNVHGLFGYLALLGMLVAACIAIWEAVAASICAFKLLRFPQLRAPVNLLAVAIGLGYVISTFLAYRWLTSIGIAHQ